MKRRNWTQLTAGAATLGLAFAGWLLFAPPQLGGSASYVVIVGSSMEPRLQRGDLAILRPAPDYKVGDVAAYRSLDLRRVVLHRIVRQDGTRFVFKGDHNNFLDPTEQERAAVIGKLWLRLPGIGRVTVWLRTPRTAAMLAAMLALAAAAGGAGANARRRRRRAEQEEAIALPGRRPSFALAGQGGRTALLVLCGAAGAFALLGFFAFKQPTTRTVPRPDLYEQKGTFSYAASAPRGPVYNGASVKTGEPVFLQLVRTVAVRFDYRLESTAPHAVRGTSRLLAKLKGTNDWERTITLQPETPFDGDRVTLGGTLDLPRLQALTQAVERLTGTRSDSYALTLLPEVRIRGMVAGQSVRDTFGPSLALRLDLLQLRLEPPAVGANESSNTFNRSKPGAGTRVIANRLALARLEIDVTHARRIAVVGGAAALAGALLAALLLLLARGRDEPSRIQARYGPWLVQVAPRRTPQETVLEVTTMEGLVRLAERYDRMILHEQHEGVHSYLVEEEGIVYRYRARDWLRPEDLAGEDTLRRDDPNEPSAPDRRSQISLGARLRGVPLPRKGAASR